MARERTLSSSPLLTIVLSNRVIVSYGDVILIVGWLYDRSPLGLWGYGDLNPEFRSKFRILTAPLGTFEGV